MRIIASVKENQKTIVMAVLIAFGCFLTVYFHLILGICTIFTHFMYIPIILASFWWKRKGIVVAVFLTGVLIIGHKIYSGNVGIDEDYLRGFSFILVSTVVAFLSERVAREEKMVRDSHAELDQIFQTAADGMRVVDKNFNMLRTNETFLKLAGISRDKAAGRKCYEVFPGPLCHTPGCSLTRILGGEKYVEDEVEKERADGKKIPCIVTATPFRESGGDVIGIVEDFKDITERKLAEDEIKFNHAELDQIFRTAADGMRVIDKEFNILRMNETFLELAGISRDKASGSKCYEVFPGSHCHTPDCCLARILGGEENVEDEVEKECADGKRIPCIVTATPFRDSGGDVIGIVEDFKDITNRKLTEEELIRKNEELHAAYEQLTATEETLRQKYDELSKTERELRQSENKYHGLVELLPQTLFELDEKGTITTVNRIALKSFGYTQEDLTKGVNGFQMLVSEDRNRARENTQRILNGEILGGIEYRAMRKDGSTFPIIIYSDAIIQDMRPVGIRGVLVDITERKRAEDAFNRASRKLNMLNSIAFTDIQNAVFSLSGYFELEKLLPLDEKMLQFIDIQIGIVQTITESLKFVNNYENLGLKPPAWQSVQESFVFGISHLDISKLSRKLNVKELEIYADPLLENVFFTLAENVVLHGETATEIALWYRETPEGLTLVFEDNGMGIPEDMKEKIFIRTYEKKKGIGLFLAREILEITSMTIKECGEPGKGARFEIFIPKGTYRFPSEQ